MIFSILPHLLWAQYQFNFENCRSGSTGIWQSTNWEQVPTGRWECTEEGAIANALSLHHSYDNPEKGCDQLTFTHDLHQESDSLVLSFRLRHGYPPSSANNWQLALLADVEKAGINTRINNGIVLGVNFTGSDDLVKIWKCTNGSCDVLVTSTINFQEMVGTNNAPFFRLVWRKDGVLELFYALNPLEEAAKSVGWGRLDTLPDGRQLVIRYLYSAAQDRNLWLDDVSLEGNFVLDTIAPVVTGVSFLQKNILKISFSENVELHTGSKFRMAVTDGSLLENPGRNLDNGISPDSIYILKENIVLKFSEPIPNREVQELWISSICDKDGNCMLDTTITFIRNDAEWGDLVLNEVMVDPSPVVRLPDEEFIELYNRSEYNLNLTDWRIEVDERSYFIPEMTVEPASFVVLKGIPLPNEGATVALRCKEGTLVHAARYQIPWDGIHWKKEGGWSLESPDPEQPCNISKRWGFSFDPSGGTPGRTNSNDSEYQDMDPPVMLYMGYGKDGLIQIRFSEPVRFSSWDVNRVVVMPGEMNPLSIEPHSPLSEQFNLWFSEDLRERNSFQLELPVVADCAGNHLRAQKLQAGSISCPVFGSLLINEIMFDPSEGDPEYIELYLPEGGYYDLMDLTLHVMDDGALPDHPIALSVESRILNPGEHLVVAKSVPHLMNAYNLELSGRWIEVNGMTGMKNNGGTVYLTDRTGAIVDMVSYGAHMHLDLLDDTKGISLERISYDRPGNDPGNWHSAASIEGYATPGRVNSQVTNGERSDNLLLTNPGVFSPDNDGFQDLLEISVSLQTQGWILRMWISDLSGKRIRSLANNHIAAPAVNYTWDGEGDNGVMVPVGIYIIHAMGYHPVMKEKWIRREAVGVVYR